MSEKKNCCDFFKKLFKKQPTPAPTTSIPSNSPKKPKNNENNEVINHKKTVCTEGRSSGKPVGLHSESQEESESNSIFYDKNSAILEKIDKTKAMENLEEAFGIINHSDDSIISNRKSKSPREKFTKVIRGINFKEILAEDSIVISELSESSNPVPIN
ncbi:hypothetical protein SteCoe_3176 [Stentor coeruleus]|uniref:Uncharacterized protein n=1 Tax=Stentor coeruleus TaxID=5963 RepID=A0A1R2CXK8_9CILI|nr:hypothetical protein SteCoe_3176 [Stentor coeruleus]